MWIQETEGLPLWIWTDAQVALDPECLRQARNVAALPTAHGHVALMPDVHVGFGMPIGCVVATSSILVPNAVGVDIGCGMHFIRTDLSAQDLTPLRKDLALQVAKRVPLGFDRHQSPRSLESVGSLPSKEFPQLVEAWEKGAYQIGTLGGGNHFIELQRDEMGALCIMVHSGSRHFGYQVAKIFGALADNTCQDIKARKSGLSFFEKGDPYFDQYLSWMYLSMAYARENRRQMAEEVLAVLKEALGSLTIQETLDVHHNYASCEVHDGKSLWVHRKGAIRAGYGERGIIPGAMARASYIVRGLGSKDSFTSASHGAGRLLGRKEARKSLSRVTLQRQLLEEDVYLMTPNRKGILEEAPDAYKPIEDVLFHERDLVEPLEALKALVVIKG